MFIVAKSLRFPILGRHVMYLFFFFFLSFQGEFGPFEAGMPTPVPLWLAVNFKQRRRARILPPSWMNVGK